MDAALQERKRYNDVIESTDISCAIDARNIHGFGKTERGATIIDLYEHLYSDFDLLHILTANLTGIKESEEAKDAKDWLSKNISILKSPDDKILEACEEGAEVFIAYHNCLMDKGYISLPGR
jgi:hypothetical protein